MCLHCMVLGRFVCTFWIVRNSLSFARRRVSYFSNLIRNTGFFGDVLLISSLLHNLALRLEPIKKPVLAVEVTRSDSLGYALSIIQRLTSS